MDDKIEAILARTSAMVCDECVGAYRDDPGRTWSIRLVHDHHCMTCNRVMTSDDAVWLIHRQLSN
jgi:hypothetical protein